MKLILMRHGEASYGQGESDKERPLTEYGHAQARAAGTWIAEQGLVIDAVLCSSARRTRETLEALRQTSGLQVEAQLSDELYLAGPNAMAKLIDEQRPRPEGMLVIAHNPGLGGLASSLSGQRIHFSTASINVIDLGEQRGQNLLSFVP